MSDGTDRERVAGEMLSAARKGVASLREWCDHMEKTRSTIMKAAPTRLRGASP